MIRALLPREHGAYAEFLLPLAAVLIAGAPGPAAWWLSVAAVCGFLAHEPLAVVWGRRGERRRVESRSRAMGMLALLAAIGVGSGVAGLTRGGGAVALGVVVCVTLAAASIALLALKLERTTFGEGFAAMTMASVAVPVGIAAGFPVAIAAAIALVWAVGAALATVAVRGILRVAKERGSVQPEVAASAAVLVLAIAAVLSTIPGVPPWIAPALCPLAFVSLTLGAFRPRPAQVRQVGWSLVGANVVTLAIMVVGV